MLALKSTDERVLRGQDGVARVSLRRAAVARGPRRVEGQREEGRAHRYPPFTARWTACCRRRREKLAIPHRFSADMTEIWAMQPRFEQRFGRRPWRLLEHPRFRAGYDFLQLRCESGEIAAEIGEWWTRFQRAGEAERAGMLVRDARGAGQGAPAAPAPPRRAAAGPAERRRRPRPKDSAASRMAAAADMMRSITQSLSHRFRRAGQQPRGPGRRRSAAALAAIGEAAADAARARRPRSIATRLSGYLDQPDFVNAVAMIETGLGAARAARRRCSASSARTAARALGPERAAHARSRHRALRRARDRGAGSHRSAPAHCRARLRAGALAEIAPDAVVPGRGPRRRPRAGRRCRRHGEASETGSGALRAR